MKIVEIRVELKQGLPNYSGRTASATAIADREESMDVKAIVQQLVNDICAAWGEKVEKAQGEARVTRVPDEIKAPAPAAATPAEAPKRGRPAKNKVVELPSVAPKEAPEINDDDDFFKN